MKAIIKHFISSLGRSSKSIEQKSLLIGKPWSLLDNDGAIQKLIFEPDNGLILSKNGQVTQGSWKYYPDAKLLFIDRGTDKILLKEQYIDDNIMLLKLDGTVDEFYALANENTIPNLDIPSYLLKLKIKEHKIAQFKLFNGNTLLVFDALGKYIPYGHKVELIDSSFNTIPIPDGIYLSHDQCHSFHITNNVLAYHSLNGIHKTVEGAKVAIENSSPIELHSVLNERIYANGLPITSGNIFIKPDIFFVVKNGLISKIKFHRIHYLANGTRIQVEQSSFNKISKGDLIIFSEPISPLPDGRYRIARKLSYIKIKNQIIV